MLHDTQHKSPCMITPHVVGLDDHLISWPSARSIISEDSAAGFPEVPIIFLPDRCVYRVALATLLTIDDVV
jgi:hypothetical protein